MINNQWVITVNSQGDKVNSRYLIADTETEARDKAEEWIKGLYGDYSDWTLHKVHTR